MKYLADENFPGPTVRALRQRGIDVAWATEEGSGAPDEAVLDRCAQHGLTLLTLDKDFGELVFRRRLPATCGVILFRLDFESPDQFTEIALGVLEKRADWDGFFSVVDNDRIRMRRLRPE